VEAPELRRVVASVEMVQICFRVAFLPCEFVVLWASVGDDVLAAERIEVRIVTSLIR
jgi:hypothetical protein